MSEECGEKPATRIAVTSRKMFHEKYLRSEDGEDGHLLPGMFNDTVLDEIVPKLRWRTCHQLSLVSRSWREANQSRQVYDARVRSHSGTERLFVLNHSDGEGDTVLSLYSVRDNSWHLLPKFPKARRCDNGYPSQNGVRSFSRSVSLGGKIYVFGGVNQEYGETDGDGMEVYALDLGGQGEWQQCANMPQQRYLFDCGVLSGKIYVLGGSAGGKPVRESVVYDPKTNVWSSIQPMKFMRQNHRVVAFGEELFVLGGQFAHPDLETDPFRNNEYNPFGLRDNGLLFTTEVYHPGKEEWRVLERHECYKSSEFFTAKGKLYMTSPEGIYVNAIDSEGNYSWTRLHSFLFEDHSYNYSPIDYRRFIICATQAGNDELLGLYSWAFDAPLQTALYQSEGFGSNHEQLLWHRIDREMLEHDEFEYFMLPIQL
ncbi:unnamed protein product [Calypogeia fissa]